MAIRGAKLTFGVGGKIWEYKSSSGRKKPIRIIKEKWATFFLEKLKMLYFVGAPFEFSGRAPFKLVTPLPSIHNFGLEASPHM